MNPAGASAASFSRSSSPTSPRRCTSIRSTGPVTLTASERPPGRTRATPTQAMPASFSSTSEAQPRYSASVTTSARCAALTVRAGSWSGFSLARA